MRGSSIPKVCLWKQIKSCFQRDTELCVTGVIQAMIVQTELREYMIKPERYEEDKKRLKQSCSKRSYAVNSV